jgi:hypothetical protein
MRLQLLAAWRRIGKAKAGTTISVAFLFAMGAEAQHRWHPLPQRSQRLAQGMAYDPDRKVVVMYGGAAGGVLDSNGPEAMQQTWEWDGVRWHERRPKHSPGPRRGASMCFDPVARRIHALRRQ